MANILLIEDDFFLRAILKHAVEEMGHAVVDAANATGAESLHLEHGFDVILTDLIMPERDGFELLSNFRKRFPQVRIIAMSAGGCMGAPEYLRIARQLGATDTLKKPVTDAELGLVLNRVLACS
jgi:CheY-like chemotaxis protein